MKRSIFCILLAFPIFCCAQSNYQKGYLITNSGDTLKGFINYKEVLLNPVSLSYKDSKAAKPQEFFIKDAAGYTVENQVSFRRFPIKKTTSQVELRRLSLGPDGGSKEDTVWLQVLQEGKNVSLYYYRDKLKIRYYLREHDAKFPNELIVQTYLSPKDNVSVLTDNRFINQLTDVLQKYRPDLKLKESKITGIRYNDKELVDFVGIINDQKIESAGLSSVRFFAGAGINGTKGFHKDNPEFPNSAAEAKVYYFPILTAGFDFFINPAIGRLIVRAEVSITNGKSETVAVVPYFDQTLTTRHAFDHLSILFTPQAIYNLYNTDKVKAFIGAGLVMNYFKYSKNVSEKIYSGGVGSTVQKDLISLTEFKISGQVSAGIVLNKRIEVVGKYFLPVSIAYYYNHDILLNRYSLGVNYLFGKH
jgi:hypothetical protein